jgi:hypothetical protein
MKQEEENFKQDYIIMAGLFENIYMETRMPNF